MLIRLGAAAAAIASALLAFGCEDTDDNQQPGTGSGSGSGEGSGSGSGTPTPTPTTPMFRVTTLVTDATQPQLINPWGIAPAEGFFWIADEGTGNVSVLDANGRQSDEYPIGRFCLGDGITGVVHIETDETSGADEFMIKTGSTLAPAEFIFANSNGTLIAINDDSPSAGVTVVDSSARGAVYLGVATIDSDSGPLLLAADFKNARVDIFDKTFKPVTPMSLTDSKVPAGWGPFNVMHLNDRVFVAWAKQEDDDPSEEEHGPGLGMVSVFDMKGNLISHIENNGFNSPWGMAIMQTKLADQTLLIGNLGDGHITAFDATSYAQLGQLIDETGKPLAIDGLWGIVPGSADAGTAGSLYWVAGPDDETHGAFGRVDQL
jgi:uncharacterized protein (TIGR03118 family)